MEHKLNSVILDSITSDENPFTPYVIEVSIGTPLSDDKFFAVFGERVGSNSYNILDITDENRFVRFHIAPKTVGMPVEDSSFYIDVPIRRVISLHYDRVDSCRISIKYPIISQQELP